MKYLFLLLFLTGCATDTAILRVIEYEGGFLTNQVGGIAVHQQPGKTFADVTIHYKGEKSEVVVDSKGK